MKDFVKRIGSKAGSGAQIVVVGGLTGLFAGIVVTLYNLLASMTEEFASGYYGFFRDNPAFIPLLFLALALGSVVIGGTLKFLPMIRGSGIPQTEGATRGLIHYKWWQVLPAMFAASLFTIFMGLSAGSEGPSLTVGGACGYGVSDLLKRNAMVRRYQITGGACAGLAVAFNAPLTGMAFAFEEAHKRFTPEVFICAFSSVIVAVLTRNLLRPL
ncbi:MAG: chloride channel protein, partial [Clostridia bacterium]|nr:chloride channel protein [Clostridia bacterium]